MEQVRTGFDVQRDGTTDIRSDDGAERRPVPDEDDRAELAPSDWTTADEIRRRAFPTVARGYDPEAVRDYLTRLADWFTDLNIQLSRLRKSEARGGDPSEAPLEAAHNLPSELASRMAEVLKEAEEHASRVRGEAEDEARRIIARARDEAIRAQAESGDLVQRARLEAEKRLGDLRAVREALIRELMRVRERVAEITDRLEEPPGPEPVAAPEAMLPTAPDFDLTLPETAS
ncbi:MAG: DivIVA domain-containing protein [Actinobacteria bacterium]|nr:DivIVA domain-containing protein [Actinomycetota bacterium]